MLFRSGPNGGGKSTLVNLICRFYDPTRGRVLLDGVPLTDIALHDLRRRIALVTQQTELFNESILYNIRYGRWDATEDEIIAHCRATLARFKAPTRVVFGPLPKTATGKIQKYVLRDLVKSASAIE